MIIIKFSGSCIVVVKVATIQKEREIEGQYLAYLGQMKILKSFAHIVLTRYGREADFQFLKRDYIQNGTYHSVMWGC